jgi:hypothetical protein
MPLDRSVLEIELRAGSSVIRFADEDFATRHCQKKDHAWLVQANGHSLVVDSCGISLDSCESSSPGGLVAPYRSI